MKKKEKAISCLKIYLKLMRISHADFAKIIEVSDQSVSNYMVGKYLPSMRVAARIEEKTKGAITPKMLMEDWESMNS